MRSPLEQLGVVALEQSSESVEVAAGHGADLLDKGDRGGGRCDRDPLDFTIAHVAEAVRSARGHQDGAARPHLELLVADQELDLTLDEVEGLLVRAM
jgi:hypothetical protein